MPLGDIFIHDTYLTGLSPWPVLALLFVLGAVFGSFVNVVAYRLPRRISLSFPGSRCPACGHPIRWYDNVPIIGWLLLGGRCRDCHAAMSLRYPLVEAAVAVTSALVGWSAMIAVRLPADEAGALFEFDFGAYAFYFLLMCSLISAAIIEWDGRLPPARMLVHVAVVGFAAACFWPNLRPGGMFDDDKLRGVYEGAAGLLAALLVGALAWPAWVANARQQDVAAAMTNVAQLALIGVFLGARDGVIIGLCSMICFGFARAVGWTVRRGTARARLGIDRFGWAGWLAFVTLVRVATGLPRLGPTDDVAFFVQAGILTAVFALVARFLGPSDLKSREM